MVTMNSDMRDLFAVANLLVECC